jgi:AraC-like DNA-binding protein
LVGALATGGCADRFPDTAAPAQILGEDFQTFTIDQLIDLIDPLDRRRFRGDLLLGELLKPNIIDGQAIETPLQTRIRSRLESLQTELKALEQKRAELKAQQSDASRVSDRIQNELAEKRIALKTAAEKLEIAKKAYAQEPAMQAFDRLEREIAEGERSVLELSRLIADYSVSRSELRRRLDAIYGTSTLGPPSPSQIVPLKGKAAVQAGHLREEIEKYTATLIDLEERLSGWRNHLSKLRQGQANAKNEIDGLVANDEYFQTAREGLATARAALQVTEHKQSELAAEDKLKSEGDQKDLKKRIEALDEAIKTNQARFEDAYKESVKFFTEDASGTDNGELSKGRKLHLALLAADSYPDAKSHRNRIQERLMAASQEACNSYKDGLRKVDSAANFALGSLTTILGGISPLFSGSSDVFGALAGVSSGIRSEFNTTFFQNLSLHVITRGIDSRRDIRLANIRLQQRQQITTYNVTAAVVDAIKFHNDCSLNAGLEEASDALQLANNFRTGNIGVAEATRTLMDIKSLTKHVDELREDGPVVSAYRDVQKAKNDIEKKVAEFKQRAEQVREGLKTPEEIQELEQIKTKVTEAEAAASEALVKLASDASDLNVRIASIEDDLRRATLTGRSGLQETRRLLLKQDQGVAGHVLEEVQKFNAVLREQANWIDSKVKEISKETAEKLRELPDEKLKESQANPQLAREFEQVVPGFTAAQDAALARNLAISEAQSLRNLQSLIELNKLADKLQSPAPAAQTPVQGAPVGQVTPAPVASGRLEKSEADAIVKEFKATVPGITGNAALTVDLSDDNAWPLEIRPYIEEIQIALPAIKADAIDGQFGGATRAATNLGGKPIDAGFVQNLFKTPFAAAAGNSKLEAALEKPDAGATDTHAADRAAIATALGLAATFDKLSDAGVRDAIKAKRAQLGLAASDHLSVLMIQLMLGQQSPPVPCTTICAMPWIK